jgi:predicted dehydrogenase
MSQQRVRFAVIGLGMGRSHVEKLRQAPHADVIAICDTDTSRLDRVGNDYWVNWRTTNYHEVLGSPDVDAVVVAVPNALHAPLTIDALRAGKHVLVEKPMARSAAEAETMLAAALECGRKLMVHFNYRFTAAAMALHRYVDAGELGDVYHARSWWHRTRGIPGLGTWFTSKEAAGGGPLVDLGVHRLDLALWYMGYPAPVTVSAATYAALGKELAAKRGKPFEVEDMASAFIRFENGATLILEASWAANGEQSEEMLTQVYGTRSGVIHRNTGGYEFESRVFREEQGCYVTITPQSYPRDFDSAQEHFARCILEDKQPLATGEHGLAVMRILDATYLSAQCGAEVRL